MFGRKTIMIRGGFVAGLLAGVMSVGTYANAATLPLADGPNNLTGVMAGLQEDYVRTVGGEYLNPAELYGGAIPGLGNMPGEFESTRLVAGVPVGINIAQPAFLGAGSGDSRAGTANTLLPAIHPAFGLPFWGPRNGAVGELTENQTLGVNLEDNKFSVFAWGFTPSSAFGVAGSDDGLAPGSVAADGIPDFAPFLGGPVPGSTAIIGVTFFGGLDDPSGAAGLFTPRIRMYEGGLSFDVSSDSGASLDESEFDHNLGPAGAGNNGGLNPLTHAVDGELLLDVEVLGVSTVFLTFTLNDADGNGIINSLDEVLMSIQFNGGLSKVIGGSLVDSGQVSLGSLVSFGFNIQQTLFMSNATGTDPNGNVYDFAALTGVTSASGNISFTIAPPDNVIPEPASALLMLAGMGGLLMKRRRIA